MRILTEKKLALLLAEEARKGRKVGYDIRKDEEARAEPRKKFEKFRDIPITIVSVVLTSEPVFHQTYEFHFGGTTTFSSPVYTIKFRLRNGIETGMELALDDPDFSMSDIRRMIAKEICGDICGGEVNAN